jgi:hypothetical protein
MNLFSRLLKGDDPTGKWPPPSGKPAIDLDGKVGPLRLGDPLDQARPLGRPEKYDATGTDVDLEYDGYHLEFKEGRLVCAAFDIDGGTRVAVGEFTLSSAATPLDVQVWLGDPSSDSTSGDGLRWIDYERSGNTLALEFEKEKLVYVQLYAEGYA